jgi:hypothetical protein
MSDYKTPPTTQMFPLPSPMPYGVAPVSGFRPPVHVKPDAEPLDFWRAIYTDPQQPMFRRMQAAIDALPYAHVEIRGKGLAGLSQKEIKRLLSMQRGRA